MQVWHLTWYYYWILVVPTEFLVLFSKTYNVWFACMSNHSNLIIWLKSPIAINHSLSDHPWFLMFKGKMVHWVLYLQTIIPLLWLWCNIYTFDNCENKSIPCRCVISSFLPWSFLVFGSLGTCEKGMLIINEYLFP